MKRYLIFMFDNYYPTGGANDFIGSAENKEEIKTKVINYYKSAIYGNRENLNIMDTKLEKTYGTKEEDFKDYYIGDSHKGINEEKLNKILESIED